MAPSPVQRVLMTTDTVGGVWTYTLDLAGALAARGVDVLIAIEGPEPDAAQREAALRLAGTEVVVTGVDLEWRDRRGELDRASAASLLRLAVRFAPDIVHLNGFRDAILDWGVPTVVVAHSCVGSWWRACRGGEAPAEWDAYTAAVRHGLATAGAIVAPTEAHLRAMADLYGTLPTARVVMNGRSPCRATTARREPMILTAGRLWDEGKNIAALGRIAPRLEWPVLAAGEPSREVTPHLTWVGRQPPEALAALMGRAEIYCAPAKYEPFGLAILEAAAAGAALVLGRLSSLVELWDDAAMFVDPDDDEALAAAINQLAGDPGRRALLRRLARRRAASFTAERMATGYLALYGELAAPRAGQGLAA